MQSYASLQEPNRDHDERSHVLFQAEPKQSRWHHITDLDSFFTHVYKYHQNHGFYYMLLQEVFELNQFAFVVILTAYLVHGVNYSVLFQYTADGKKRTLNDVILSPGECIGNFTFLTWFIVVVAFLVYTIKLLRGVYKIVQFWDIKQFYNVALGVIDYDLENMTWHEIQKKLIQAQPEHQMCIQKNELTELHIYHRILRQKNYLIALVNKRLLPPRFNLPIIGEVVYWTKTLSYNVQFLMFWSPWSPFENLFHLKEEYYKNNLRQELADKLGKQILYLALINFIFAPLIFLWQILYAFFFYTDLFRRDPAKAGMRNWSPYGLLYLRHFNELDHELNARLIRAHRPASRYLAAFNSPIVSLVGHHIGFLAGSIVAVLIVLTVYDEDVLGVDHVLTLLSCLGAVVAICRGMQPDETVPQCPESLLSNVVIHTHYLPTNWRGRAHKISIRTEFQQLFQYRISGLLENVFSPILTPYVLWRCIYPKSLDIIDFLRNFTISVAGVGDVCSFAQMDIRKHGNPDWLSQEINKSVHIDQYTQAEDGKVELSLVHFTKTNPEWVPPETVRDFVDTVNQYSLEVEPVAGSHMQQSAMNETLNFNLNSPFFDDSLNDMYTSRWMAEGPDVHRGAMEMGKSVMYLHNKQRDSANRLRNVKSMDERTPLLLQDP